MSGLLERIARRRRASASRRLGPPAQNGAMLPAGKTPLAEPWAPVAEQQREPSAELEAHPTEQHTPSAELDTPPAEAPAPPPDPEPEQPEPPTILTRGRIRRRALYLRQLREVQLRDIGGFMLELRRFGEERPELVQAKLAGAASTDRELRGLERALRERVPVRELREAGIGGACSRCGALHSSSDRFCAWCGAPLRQAETPHEPPVPER